MSAAASVWLSINIIHRANLRQISQNESLEYCKRKELLTLDLRKLVPALAPIKATLSFIAICCRKAEHTSLKKPLDLQYTIARDHSSTMLSLGDFTLEEEVQYFKLLPCIGKDQREKLGIFLKEEGQVTGVCAAKR